MAFATSNVFGGPIGNRFKLEGDWTGNSGDATGTLTVSGGRVYDGEFVTQNPTGPTIGTAPYSVSGPTNGNLTISIYNHEEVTAGRFFLIYG